MHEKILKPLRKTAKNIKAWWNFTGKPEPSEEEILDSLKRLVSGVLTHPVTIGKYTIMPFSKWLLYFQLLKSNSFDRNFICVLE